jgi:hypothetical protein
MHSELGVRGIWHASEHVSANTVDWPKTKSDGAVRVWGDGVGLVEIHMENLLCRVVGAAV